MRNNTLFVKELYAKPPMKNYATNKTDLYHINDVLRMYILDLTDYGLHENRGYGYVFLIIDNFSKFEWTVSLKNNTFQAMKISFRNILTTSKRKL